MGNRPAERPVLRSFRVDVDPLVVAGRAREQVDTVLLDGEPFTRPDLASHRRSGFRGRGEEECSRHARWLDTETISPVM